RVYGALPCILGMLLKSASLNYPTDRRYWREMGVLQETPTAAAPLSKLMKCQLVTTAGDERVNLLLNMLLLFSLPPLGAFVIYFALSTLLIWCAALFAQCKRVTNSDLFTRRVRAAEFSYLPHIRVHLPSAGADLFEPPRPTRDCGGHLS